jgi:hypothetical protein
MRSFFKLASVGLFLTSALSFATVQQSAGTIRAWGSDGNGDWATDHPATRPFRNPEQRPWTRSRSTAYG